MSEYEGKYKYLCIGGFVRSKDGDRHYVHDGMLSALYGVHPHECLSDIASDMWVKRHTLIQLTPRDSGDYQEHLAILKAEKLLNS
jgi:hypothetical protein